MLGRPSTFRAALMGSTALTPVAMLYMQAAAEADRVQAAADGAPLIPLNDRVDAIIGALLDQMDTEADASLHDQA